MRNLILFLLIMTICASVTNKPDIQPCSTKIQAQFYQKGKRVFQKVWDDGNWWCGGLNAGRPDNHGLIWDSVFVDIYFEPIKK